MDQETKEKLTTFCGGCCLFFLIIILAFSWDTVEPTQWGLKYNSIGKSIDASTEIAQPLKTRSAEGLALGLHISFQYQLIPEELGPLYSMSNVDYEATFIRIARDTILQEAGNYEAPKYWQERNAIGEHMRKQLDEQLQEAHARCIYLQILEIELPESYEDSIVLTQVEVQKSKMKKFEQEAAIIRQQIDILRSENSQNIKLINATGNAEAYRLIQAAKANATRNIIEVETDQYDAIKNGLGLDETELNKYIFYNGMQGKDNHLFVGFSNNLFTNQNTQ